MARVSGNIWIRRPVEEVFDFAADQTNEPGYNPQMLSSVRVTEPPLGVGTRFEAVVRSGHRNRSMTIEVTDFDRPHRMASTSRVGGMVVDGTTTFRPEAEGTRMSWLWDVRPGGLLRLVGPLVGFVGSRQEHRVWTGLKDHLEHAESTSRTR